MQVSFQNDPMQRYVRFVPNENAFILHGKMYLK